MSEETYFRYQDFIKYKKAIEKNGMHWELVPVGMHQRNVAEKQHKNLKAISNQSYAE